MKKIVGVSFKKNGQVYYFDSNNIDLKKGDNVIVKTDRGLQFGYVSLENSDIKLKKEPLFLNTVERICTVKDVANNENNRASSKKVLKKCKELVKKDNLNMIILDASYNFDRSQLFITFLADNRVDFRKLAKDLAAIYKTRIELRQVGVRDKAREIGGYGCCGKELCCSMFSYEFDSVSIHMAKNQNIALNPTKINGICGRLLCCLKYEDECYKECNKKLPKVGKKIETECGEGKVISLDPLNLSYKVDVKDKGIIEVKVNESN